MSWTWIVIALGGLIILGRAPLMIAPKRALTWSEESVAGLLGTDLRVRVLGLVYLAIAAACLNSVGEPGAGLFLVQGFGWFCAIAGVWTLVAPSQFRDVVASVIQMLRELGPSWARGLGAFSVGIGVLLIYLGTRAL